MKQKTVVIFEDKPDLRESLCLLVNGSDKYSVLDTYPNCRNIEAILKEHRPEVVLMDIDMPVVNGIEGLKRIKAVSSETMVIMLTIFDHNDYIFDAMKAGADGYLLKKSKPEEIIRAINEVLDGGAPMTPSIAKKVLSSFTEKTHTNHPKHGLTPKETEVLKLLVEGYSYKMAADDLGVVIETVRSHIKNIYRKLQVNSMSEAVVKAIRENLV